MKNIVVETFSTDAWRNLALEETIVETTERGEVTLYLWQNDGTVVIGRNQNAWRECRCSLLEADGCRLARRRSGGGAVFHDAGNLNFTFAASPERYDLKKQNSVIIEACRASGIDAEFTGRNDMTAGGRKFSGCAFLKTQKCVMHHGTLLISADMEKMGRYLAPSAEKLRSKGVASVRARVANLAEFSPGLSPDTMRERLRAAFSKIYGEAECRSENYFPRDMLDRLTLRNSSWDWNFGITPEFNAELKKRFEWGDVQMLLSVKKGRVISAKVYTDAMDPMFAEQLENAALGKRCGKEIADAVKNSCGGAEMSDTAKWLETAF